MSVLQHQNLSGSTTRTGVGIGGALLLIFAGFAFFWMYPEMRRYLRIRRM